MDHELAGIHLDAGAHGVAVAPGSLEYQADPVVLGRRVVAKYGGMPVLFVDDDVDVAVIVQIAKGRPPAHVSRVEVGADIPGGQLETLSLQVPEQQGNLLVINRLTELTPVVVNVAVGHEVVR